MASECKNEQAMNDCSNSAVMRLDNVSPDQPRGSTSMTKKNDEARMFILTSKKDKKEDLGTLYGKKIVSHIPLD